MAEYMNQLFSVDELRELDEKLHEILKGEIRRQLISNPDIIRALEKKIRPMYNQLTGRGPRRRKVSRKRARTRK
jgi:hypothetical protein